MARSDPAMTGQVAYERVENDFYATPPEYLNLLAHYIDLSAFRVWEPACGEGNLSVPLAALSAGVVSTDLVNRGYGVSGVDFTKLTSSPRSLTMCNERFAIITNPPYGDMAEEFIRKALELTEPHMGLVAMFLRNEYDCAATTRDDLFEGHPAYARKIVSTRRPRWVKGSKGSPRHNYAWYVWDWQRPHDAEPIINYRHPNKAKPKRAA